MSRTSDVDPVVLNPNTQCVFVGGKLLPHVTSWTLDVTRPIDHALEFGADTAYRPPQRSCQLRLTMDFSRVTVLPNGEVVLGATRKQLQAIVKKTRNAKKVRP